MAEHPILFKPELVRAILDGKKTETRRIAKQIHDGNEYCVTTPCGNCADSDMCSDAPYFGMELCPYGKVGDLLWVRETWCEVEDYELDYEQNITREYKVAMYKANYLKNGGTAPKLKWKPSIHMPKKYCRLRLEITDIGVERIQDITNPSIEAEGIVPNLEQINRMNGDYSQARRVAWIELWDKINAKRGFPWADSPWVWVIKFKVV